MPAVIPVISASGGAGKTTISLLLAYVLKKHAGVDPKRILIIDLDPTAGLSLRTFGDEEYDEICRRRRTLYHMDQDADTKNVRIEDYTNAPGRSAESISNVAVLPPGEDSQGGLSSRIEKWFTFAYKERLKALLEKAGALSRYDYIIVDSAPFFDARYTVVALATSDAGKAVVPLRPTPVDIKRTIRMVKTLREYMRVDPVFVFNFDKDKLVKEAVTLKSLGFDVPKPGRANPSEQLKRLIGELESYGDAVKSAMVYYKDLSDVAFPREEPESTTMLAICNPIVDVLNAMGANVPPCQARVEEG